eukprot:SAG11_NODE_20909_length_436_cov_0.602374_1_plen_53_part_10
MESDVPIRSTVTRLLKQYGVAEPVGEIRDASVDETNGGAHTSSDAPAAANFSG